MGSAPSATALTLTQRPFSTTSTRQKLYAHITRRKQKEQIPIVPGLPKKFLPKAAPEFPLYPYGKAQWFKRSDKGLYGGKIIQFGNQISEFRNKSRRSWKPNVAYHSLWSEALNRIIGIKTTARVLRTITKEGGIDRYLTKDKPARIKELGLTGWKLRYRVLKKLEIKEKTAPKVLEYIEKDGQSVPVFFKHTSSNGSELKITVGKRKLMAELFAILKGSESAPSYKTFYSEYVNKPASSIISDLESHNFNFSKVSA